MPKCVICGEVYYNQSELDPEEPCVCGQMAWGRLYDWNGWRAYRDWAFIHLAGRLCDIEALLWRYTSK